MKTHSLALINKEFHLSLAEIYDKNEIESLFKYVVKEILNFSSVQIFLHKDDALSQADSEKFLSILNELKTCKPIQYILGYNYFCDLKILCSPDALIPRPETEELVHNVLSFADKSHKIRILDICTGTGCIALALKKNLPNAEVFACDISEKALDLAKKNAKNLNLEVEFFLDNALILHNLPVTEFDIIVSNPPYVSQAEKQEMHKNVLDFEPHLALFPNSEDDLIFYKSIAFAAKQMLRERGMLFFEINQNRAKKVENILQNLDFSDIKTDLDLNNRPRITYARQVNANFSS